MRIRIAIFAVFFFATAIMIWAAVPTTLSDFFLPGSQPNQSGNLETPDKCDNCHGGYDIAVEPAFGWRGGMMSQAARDPLFYACLAISNQDAPESGDLCIRCHSPAGWLKGRSTPTDGSALNNTDREGVQCDFCHKLVKPTQLGVNPFPDDTAYTADTYDRDQTYLATITEIPPVEADGMYVADNDNAKRGPFADANPTHQKYYSPFHSTADLCGTCHDVSNPAFSRDSSGDYVPNTFNQAAPDFDPYAMFPIERTFSEWKMSAYNTPTGVYAPQFGGNKDTVSTCQDCHMRDVTGKGCNKSSAPIRTNLPLHDQTGGNTFIPLLINAVFPGESDPAALDSGVVRAAYMLQNAATMNVEVSDEDTAFRAEVEVINETGHKLPSGYPEGRRIWINVRAFNSNDELIYESGAYDTAIGVLTHDANAKIYEIKPGISNSLAPIVQLPAGVSFHFVLNDTIYSDNRIPPRGFTNAAFETIQSPPVGYSYADGQYWDETEFYVPNTTSRLVVNLYYQTTSKEYVEFLRDENVTNDWGTTFYNLWSANGKSAPVLMNTDTLFLTPVAQNHPPVLDSIGPKSVDEGANLSFSVSASDPDGDIPALTTSDLPDGAGFIDHSDGTGTFSWMTDYTQSDIYNIVFYATDDSLAVDSEEVQITVNNVNRPPVLDSIGSQSVEVETNLNFGVTASDPDGDPIILSTSTLPENADFSDNGDGSGLFSWTPSAAQTGIHEIMFFAADTFQAEDSEIVEITVFEGNQPPVLDPIGNKDGVINQLISFVVTASDPNGDSVSLSAENLPAGASFSDNGWDSGLGKYKGTFEWTPDELQGGTYENIGFIASDGLLTDDEFITVTVEAYICGDANRDDRVNVSDAVYVINYVFVAGDPPDPLVSGEVNCDGTVNVSDAVYIINYVFIGGSPPCDTNDDGAPDC